MRRDVTRVTPAGSCRRWPRLLPSARASLKAALATAWFTLTAAGLPHWSDMDGTGTDRLHSLFCPLQMISPSLVGMLESGFGEGRWPRNIVPARLCRNQVATESPTLRRTPEGSLKSG